MRKNFSRGNSSASLVSGQTSSGDTSACPQNFQLPNFAALLDKCKVLWMQITTEIAAIRDDFDKYFPGKSFAAEKPATENMASCRNRMTIMKRVGNLMRSAQRGFRSVCAAKIQSEARSESSWEMEKRQFDPQMRAEMEKFASQILNRCESLSSREFDGHLDDKEASHVDQQDQAKVHPDESRARATVENTFRFWAEAVAHVESMVSNLDKVHADTNSQEHVSDRKVLSWFRNRTSMMKHTIGILSQAQEGLLSGFTAMGILAANLESSSAATMKMQEENLRRETMERMWLIAYESERTYGTSIPEIHACSDIRNAKTN
jgi:hypothetical protein